MDAAPPAGLRRRVVIGSAGTLFAVAAYTVLSFPVHHDIAWLLHVAGAFVDGADLYTDVVEVNPPLIIWISALAEVSARLIRVWDVFVYRSLVLLIAVASIGLCRGQLRRSETAGRGILPDVLSLALAFFFVAGPGFEFGQREHLSIMLVLPFLLLTARCIEGGSASRREDVAAGVLAGIGFSIKPHFAVAWLAVELYTLMRRRRVAIGAPHLAVVTVFMVYAAAVLLFERDYLVMSRLAAGAYTRMSASSWANLLRLPYALWTLLAIGLAFLAVPKSAPREVFRVPAVAAVGFLIAVLLQGKGWAYHWIGATTLAGVILILIAGAWAERFVTAHRITIALAAVLLIVTASRFGDAEAQRQRMQGKAYQLPHMIGVVEHYARGGPIAAFSTNMQAAFPLVSYTDVKWALRFNAFWMLPGAYPEYPPGSQVRYHALDRMPAAERYMFDAVIDDLIRNRPTVIFVDILPPGYVLRGFDYMTYFGRDARFATLLRSYREIGAVERYRVFVRH